MKSEAMFPNHNDIELPFCDPRHRHGAAAVPPQARRRLLLCTGDLRRKGEGRLSVEGKTYDIHPGTCFFSAAGHAARLLAADGGMATNWLCFDGTCLPETVRCLGMEHSSVVELPDPTRFDALFKNVLTELHADPIFGQLRASPYVHRILVEYHLIKREQIGQQYHRAPKLKPVLDYIEEHLADVITLEELAGLMNLTPQHFCRVFKDCIGERPFQYILKRRIQVSKRYLVRPEYRVSEIGRKVGIETAAIFAITLSGWKA